MMTTTTWCAIVVLSMMAGAGLWVLWQQACRAHHWRKFLKGLTPHRRAILNHLKANGRHSITLEKLAEVLEHPITLEKLAEVLERDPRGMGGVIDTLCRDIRYAGFKPNEVIFRVSKGEFRAGSMLQIEESKNSEEPE